MAPQMPRGSAIIFGDLVGKLDMLSVACELYLRIDGRRLSNCTAGPTPGPPVIH